MTVMPEVLLDLYYEARCLEDYSAIHHCITQVSHDASVLDDYFKIQSLLFNLISLVYFSR